MRTPPKHLAEYTIRELDYQGYSEAVTGVRHGITWEGNDCRWGDWTGVFRHPR